MGQRLNISGRHVENRDGKIVVSVIKGELTFEMKMVEDPSQQPELYAALCKDDGDWCLILRPEGQRSFLEYSVLPDGGIKAKVLDREETKS